MSLKVFANYPAKRFTCQKWHNTSKRAWLSVLRNMELVRDNKFRTGSSKGDGSIFEFRFLGQSVESLAEMTGKVFKLIKTTKRIKDMSQIGEHKRGSEDTSMGTRSLFGAFGVRCRVSAEEEAWVPYLEEDGYFCWI
jgi:hypothetical protein